MNDENKTPVGHYGRYEYQAAKAFLADAVNAADGATRINFSSPTHRYCYWRKPDGTVWREWEDTLENPYWNYGLDIVSQPDSLT
jgi:hypothetical protein